MGKVFRRSLKALGRLGKTFSRIGKAPNRIGKTRSRFGNALSRSRKVLGCGCEFARDATCGKIKIACGLARIAKLLGNMRK